MGRGAGHLDRLGSTKPEAPGAVLPDKASTRCAVGNIEHPLVPDLGHLRGLPATMYSLAFVPD